MIKLKEMDHTFKRDQAEGNGSQISKSDRFGVRARRDRDLQCKGPKHFTLQLQCELQ